MSAHTVVWVLYDSVQNAVFEGQVLAPIRQSLGQRYQQAILVSFERRSIPAELIARITADERIRLIVIKRLPFIGAWGLWRLSFLLRRLLQKLNSYDLVARGALAGFIAQRAVTRACVLLTIQARGLLAQEYAYAQRHTRGITRWFVWWRMRTYHRLEHGVYRAVQAPKQVVEVVTPALQDYLVTTFGTRAAACALAHDDIPVRIAPAVVLRWRMAVRTELGIADNWTVYCFSGSVQPWQCPKQVIEYFFSCYTADSQSFLLILTPDVFAFECLLRGRLPSDAYLVIRVCHEQIYRYLAAADVGIVFRDAGVVSWVARPVKAMEYEAVGLKIVHNNTVSWLIERAGQ